MKKFAMGSLVLLLAMSFVFGAGVKEDKKQFISSVWPCPRRTSSAGRWMEPP